MDIKFKGKRENEKRGIIQDFYDSFEKLFHDRQNKTLIRNSFESGHKRSYIIDKIQSFINNGQVACNHSWGLGGNFIFQIELFYFVYNLKNRDYVYSIGFQYEQSTVKINCARNPYNDSIKDEIVDIEPIFEKHSCINSFFDKVNHGHTRAYISISRMDNNFTKYNTDELCFKLFEIIENSIDLLNDIKQDIKNKGGKFLKYYAIIKNDA
jgi:hypothetical protein